MKRLVVALFVLFPSALFAAPVPPSFADLVEKLSPAVVNVSTTQKVKSGGVKMQMFGNLPDTPDMAPFKEFLEKFGEEQQGAPQEDHEATSLGSGFIIDAGGYIITNNHVIDEADEITVRLSDNTKLKATIVGRDKKTDLALLKVKSDKPLPFVPLGDSDKARVGDWVVAIGNPFGLGGTVTAGIISARQRSINAGPYDDFIQSDAAINRGNSGGPLFNMDGEVIGINSAIFSPTGTNIGIGFSIPTNLAKPVVEQLKQFGRTHRGWLGVKIQEVTDEVADSIGLKKPIGALVAGITKGGPAAKASLQEGDVITSYNGKEITEMRFLPRLVAETKIGETVEITLMRKGKEIKTKITVGELKEGAEGEAESSNTPSKKSAPVTGTIVLGMTVSTLSEDDRKALKLNADVKGVLITDISNNSDATRRGLRAGDVITEANGTSTTSVDLFKRQIEDAKKAGRKFALLKVQRKDESSFVTLPIEK
jgi:serine protease Do